jgi:SAM-dependent methyltransferase
MLQVVQTRLLSVVLWYYMAFLVISLAMFGLTVGSLWVYLRRQRFSEHTLSHDLTYFTSLLAIATAACGAVQTTLAPAGAASAGTLLVALELGACLAVPFFLSGIVISLALTRSPFPIGRVYAVDLAGAAAGCLGVLAVLNMTDAPSAILWIGALAALAAVSFAGSGIGGEPATALPFARRLLRAKPILAVLVLCAAANGMTARGFQPMFVKGKPEIGDKAPAFVEWNSFARVSAFDTILAAPVMWGASPTFRPADWSVPQRLMFIDGDAATISTGWDGEPAHAAFLKDDVTNIAQFLPGHRRAAVIGVGGGRDMLSARVFGVPDITGVELNPILVRLLTTKPGYADFSNLGGAPGLHFEVDDGRSWFARHRDTFDIIQMSLVDTFAATGAGAYSLSENGLYTVEAWRSFVDHLTPGGVFTVSRWYAPDNVNETGRIVSLACATLFRLGASDPRQHIFLAATEDIATLVVSRTPFSAENVALLEQIAADKQYQVLLSPGREAAAPVLQRIVASADEAALRDYTSSLPLDLTPPTDERPFFFNQLPMLHPWAAIAQGLRNQGSSGVLAGNTTATMTLVTLFLCSLLLVNRTIVYPLRPAIADVGRRLAIGGTAYFGLIGAGFLSSEMGLLQRLSVFLGHPIYSLSIVLFSLILTAGIGSLVSDKFPLDTRPRFVLWALLAASYLVALPAWLPGALHSFESAALVVRATLCVVVIAPAGFLMGFGFPTGMRFISAVDRRPTPWFWGINGAAGVLASSAAVALSMAFGIYATFVIAAICYALLIPAGLVIGFARGGALASPARFVGEPT